MTRLAFYFNSARCVGCKTCVVACSKKNNLPLGVSYRRVTSYEVGEYPAATFYHWSATCNHCENPGCVRTCPTGAMYKSADGTVQHDDDVCIGCGSCVFACPYGVPQIVREEGIAKKCNACADTRDVDGAPTCVASCGMRALDFGPYDELVAAHPDSVDCIAPMADPSMTTPNVLITPHEAGLEQDYHDLVL
ncbi:MAG: 4Fe-4S dicluster domain-containing protein [Eggerthellaceae bacterium]|nr:4Fe-4S dicluster domain-containing protein [Eggerthellaceae bacterium]